MPSLCLFPLSLPRRSLHESVSQQKKKSWRSVSLLIKYIWLSLEKKLSPTTKLMSVFLCSSKVLFFQKARIQHKFQTNQVFKVLLSMINNFFNLFESWSLTLKILPCSPVDTSLLPASCLTWAHILHRTGMQLLKQHRDLCWHPGLVVTPSLPLQISLQPLIQQLKELLITTPAVDTSAPAQLLSLVSSRAGDRLCSPTLEQSIDSPWILE